MKQIQPKSADKKKRSRGEHLKKQERKDHVLQARVPESLYDDLARQARRLRVPVSNLVRNILEDSVRMVENIVDGSLEIASALGNKVDDEDLAKVIGWQPMIANRQLVCARCDRIIKKENKALISVGQVNGRSIVICEQCRDEQ